MYTTPMSCSTHRNIMAAWTDTHSHSQGVEFLIVERYVSNNHTAIMNLERRTCVYESISVCVCVSSLLKGVLFVLSRYWLRQREVLAVTRNPSRGVSQHLLGYTAQFTSKIKHGGGDMTASPEGRWVKCVRVNMMQKKMAFSKK